MTNETTPIEVQAHLHHQYFLGLQLMVSVEEGKDVVGDWIFRLFRQQHEDKFLSSFNKLGLDGLPHAVACAKYHVLSNSVGGVRVEYMADSDTKAWVRFRYPRWMYDGPALCGIPVEASRGFLKGWYAQNGVSLRNPRLGYVCVSEDLTGQFGFCGYFKEYDHDLSPEERLQFAPDETPPPFDPAAQPRPPAKQWSAERLTKASRNYAMEYCRNGILELVRVIGRDRTLEIGKRAARLTGLQQYKHAADALGCVDGDVADAAAFLTSVLAGMGDTVDSDVGADRQSATVRQHGLRIVRGMTGDDRDIMLSCWTELWRGAVGSHRQFIDVRVEARDDTLTWHLALKGEQ
ncbi:MAG: hypothetical protein OXT06_26795 [Rhodospirillaceae bacterium]|nr:hypothetical protein [Rhodospirillaceae bacterium]MDD9924575.1 hypothetical protein [Rhodospirillaceae bacterium]